MASSDPVVAHTLEFVLGALAGVEAEPRVLEIGCGSGDLAVALGARGVRIVGIDADGESVRQARKKGVVAEEGAWPVEGVVRAQRSFFDAVLFTRSLHHMHRLDAATEAAAAVLRRGGALIIEDFAYSEVTPDDALWLRSMLDVIAAAGLGSEGVPEASGVSAMEWWKREHEHDLHSWPRMEAAVRKVARVRRSEATPYVFRYVHEALRPVEQDRRESVTRAVLAHELRRVSELGCRLVGRRLVAIRDA